MVRAAADPDFTADGQMRFPDHYREWVYLSSGFDMSYTPGAQGSSMHMFDNVFVNPEAYRAFLAKGVWPEHTVMVLETRNANGRGSINQSGQYQSKEVMGLEVHVKDSARFSGKWAFYSFDKGKVAKMIPTSAGCYSCHSQHGAVDTTFVQFYPTLASLPSESGLKENGAAKAAK